MSVHIYATPEELASATADYVAAYINNSDRRVTLGLAGGSTPQAQADTGGDSGSAIVGH